MLRAILILTIATGLAGCGNPLKSMKRLQKPAPVEQVQEANLVPDAPGPEAALVDRPLAPEDDEVAPKPRRGLLGFLKKKTDVVPEPVAPVLPAAPAVVTEAAAVNDTGLAAAAPGQAEGSDDAMVADITQQIAAVKPAAPLPGLVEEEKKTGLFGGLLHRAAASGGDAPTAAKQAKPRKKAAVKAPKPGAPDYRMVSMGTRLPFGEMARLCDVPKSQLGKRAGGYPDRGASYRLYDSAPGSTIPRSFYMTGFDDGCARQFTASLVLFGSPDSYEKIHYGPAGATQSRSDTDFAYDRVKSRVCKVGKGKPCGSAMSKLARNTVFVSVYERFDSNPRWSNILLHDGQVMAMDIKQ